MNSLRNSVRLIGRVGASPEIKQAGSSQVASVALATTETYKDKDGNKVNDTQWHSLSIWGKPAENFAKYVKKGDEVAIEGRLVNRNWTDKDGVKRYKTEILVTEFLMIGGKRDAAPSPEANESVPNHGPYGNGSSDASDDLPF